MGKVDKVKKLIALDRKTFNKKINKVEDATALISKVLGRGVSQDEYNEIFDFIMED